VSLPPGALVGRDRELGFLREFFHEAAVSGGAVLLSGDPGVGKTALLNDLADSASAAGTTVLRVGFPSGGGPDRERRPLGVRGDVLLGVAFQAALMAECLAGGAGHAEGRVGMSELVGASHVGEHAADGDFGLCHTGRSS
jgi:hypothetical protein